MRPTPLPDIGGDDHARLKELILYVAQTCEDHHKFGAVKLNKILFFADFIAYARRGKSITGETYFKLPMGPAPKRLVPVLDEMTTSGEIVLQERRVFSNTQKRWIPLRDPKLEVFDGFEIALVNEVILALKHKDADQVSELSHQFIGWQLVNEREDIPYETVFLRDPDEVIVTEMRLKKAEEIARRHGLQQ